MEKMDNGDYDKDDIYDIREDVMDYDEDGAGWCSFMF